jgi:hypothetical protein
MKKEEFNKLMKKVLGDILLDESNLDEHFKIKTDKTDKLNK